MIDQVPGMVVRKHYSLTSNLSSTMWLPLSECFIYGNLEYLNTLNVLGGWVGGMGLQNVLDLFRIMNQKNSL